MRLRDPISRLLRPWHFKAWGLALGCALLGQVILTETIDFWNWLLFSLILYVYGIAFMVFWRVDEEMEEEKALKGLKEEIAELRSQIKEVRGAIKELNKNFGDFLDVIIPLIQDDVKHIENNVESQKKGTGPFGGMYG